MQTLERHRENQHCSLISSTPIKFDFDKLSCYGGSYYATIGFVSYHPKTSEFVRPSMPMSHKKILYSSLLHFRVCSPFKTIICHYQTPPRVLQLSTSTYIFSYNLTFWLHYTSMGHSRLTCTHIFFFSLEKGLGPTIFPLHLADRSCNSSLHSLLQ
jgi:hypothetical protein